MMRIRRRQSKAQRLIRCAVVALVLTLVLPAPLAGARSAERLERKPFTVVAVVDTGINPYHEDFRRPDLTAHPSTYLEGFPADTRALRLTLDANSLQDGLRRDAKRWSAIGDGELVWIPGTNIIGAVDVRGSDSSFRDETGHGTGVASIVGGKTHGTGTDDVLIVAVRSFTPGLEWAAEQPWIDIITNSWTTFDAEPITEGAAAASRRAVESGKVVCFASGNASAPLWFTGEQGPSWNLHVGAASSKNRGEHYYTGWPNDVLGIANVTAAAHDSIDGEIEFGGTSAAAPHVCGLIAKTLAHVRRRAKDWVQGPHRRALAVARGMGGSLEDGRLTNDELIDAIQATAVPAEANPPHEEDRYSIPALPLAPWVRGGYGIVDRASIKDALAVLLGRRERPDRSTEDTWITTLDTIRDTVWGDPP